MMKVLTDNEVRKFLTDNEWHHRIKVDGTNLYYAEPETTCIELKFPETPGTAVYHTWLASRLGIMDNEPQFGGALLWITYSSIGSPGLVQTGCDVTGVFCTSGSEREFTLEGSWYADEEIQAGADCDTATAG
jgi:hypothetical protein